MFRILIIFLGGGMGSLSRYSMAKLIDYKVLNFPLATLLSNVFACLILGYFLGLELKNGIADNTKLMVITGFCGGFSTFSTFSAESVKLLSEGQFTLAAINILANLISCFLFIFIGMKLGM